MQNFKNLKIPIILAKFIKACFNLNRRELKKKNIMF